jgi:hypothetical protein
MSVPTGRRPREISGLSDWAGLLPLLLQAAPIPAMPSETKPLSLVQGRPAISVLSLRFGIGVPDCFVAPAGKCQQAFMI